MSPAFRSRKDGSHYPITRRTKSTSVSSSSSDKWKKRRIDMEGEINDINPSSPEAEKRVKDTVRWMKDNPLKEDKLEKKMVHKVEITPAGIIQQFNSDKYQLAQSEDDINAIKEYFGNNEDVNEFGGFFVDTSSGDYGDVLGFYGSVPYRFTEVYRIKK